MARATPAPSTNPAAASPDAMTPQQALDTIASLRDYRERLTARAAGIVWMVWALTLGFAVMGQLAFEFAAPDVRDGAWFPAAVGVMVAVALGALALGGLATNAVWRAHAVEGEGLPPRWMAFAAGTVFVLAFIGLSAILRALLYQQTGLGFNFAPLLLLGSLGCATMAFLLRARLPPRPGLVAAAALFAGFVAAYLVPVPWDASLQMGGAVLFALLDVAAFAAVGLRHTLQG